MRAGRLTVLGGGGSRYAANPGLTPSFRRTLPVTGCLSQARVCPTGKRYAWPCPPKTVEHPAATRKAGYCDGCVIIVYATREYHAGHQGRNSGVSGEPVQLRSEERRVGKE